MDYLFYKHDTVGSHLNLLKSDALVKLSGAGISDQRIQTVNLNVFSLEKALQITNKALSNPFPLTTGGYRDGGQDWLDKVPFKIYGSANPISLPPFMDQRWLTKHVEEEICPLPKLKGTQQERLDLLHIQRSTDHPNRLVIN